MLSALTAYMIHQNRRLKPLSILQVKRHLMKNCALLHRAELSKIAVRTVSARITAIAAKNGPVEANRTRSSLAAFFNWSIGEGLATSNPAAGGNRSPEKSRSRVLSDIEIKQIWAATMTVATIARSLGCCC